MSEFSAELTNIEITPIGHVYLGAYARLNGDMSPLMNSYQSHVVWDDGNYDMAESCLEHFDDYEPQEYTDEQMAVIRWSLEELTKIPIEERMKIDTE